MPKTTTTPLTTNFAVISIRKGRKKLAALTKQGFEVEVTITGRITGVWGKDDGIDQEFSLDITDFKHNKTVRVPKDKHGRRWAMAANVVTGDKLECDGGFTCLPAGAIREVKFDPSKTRRGVDDGTMTGYYVTCNDRAAKKRHYLNGQLGYTPETKGALVGFYPVPKRKN